MPNFFKHLFRRKARIFPPTQVEGYEPTGSFTDSDEADRKVFAQLIELGSDLTQPRHCIHYFYFKTSQDADDAADQLKAMGFRIKLGMKLEKSHVAMRPWLVMAEHTAIINEQSIHALRIPFTEIAEKHGGEYDGWEAQAG